MLALLLNIVQYYYYYVVIVVIHDDVANFMMLDLLFLYCDLVVDLLVLIVYIM